MHSWEASEGLCSCHWTLFGYRCLRGGSAGCLNLSIPVSFGNDDISMWHDPQLHICRTCWGLEPIPNIFQEAWNALYQISLYSTCLMEKWSLLNPRHLFFLFFLFSFFPPCKRSFYLLCFKYLFSEIMLKSGGWKTTIVICSILFGKCLDDCWVVTLIWVSDHSTTHSHTHTHAYRSKWTECPSHSPLLLSDHNHFVTAQVELAMHFSTYLC